MARETTLFNAKHSKVHNKISQEFHSGVLNIEGLVYTVTVSVLSTEIPELPPTFGLTGWGPNFLKTIVPKAVKYICAQNFEPIQLLKDTKSYISKNLLTFLKLRLQDYHIAINFYARDPTSR